MSEICSQGALYGVKRTLHNSDKIIIMTTYQLHTNYIWGAHCHFAFDFWEKIIRMAKNCDTFFRHFRHNGENGEKIDGENGKNGEK